MTTTYHLYLGDEPVLDLRDEPGILVSTSAPPPRPGQGPVTHPFATATFRTAATEGALGAMLRGAPDLGSFLDAAIEAGYRVERDAPPAPDADPADPDPPDAASPPGSPWP
ncbi:hypothetical protein EDD28_0239 [Salana multivorans]|uniref:Uncharacterized protein n=1 Tax=Salana multivorans TaxID=120377 RepID=A0A3N2D7C6_9MICO|nr:hypothetical protein [Salana multivorans]ROR95677.1 hypothetical protein EDD28_0239 [Salana multivorans]